MFTLVLLPQPVSVIVDSREESPSKMVKRLFQRQKLLLPNYEEKYSEVVLLKGLSKHNKHVIKESILTNLTTRM